MELYIRSVGSVLVVACRRVRVHICLSVQFHSQLCGTPVEVHIQWIPLSHIAPSAKTTK